MSEEVMEQDYPTENKPFTFDLFKQFIGMLDEHSVTDIHLTPGTVPYIRQAKELKPLNAIPVFNEDGEIIRVINILPLTSTDAQSFAFDTIEFAYRDSPTKVSEIKLQLGSKGEEVDFPVSIPSVCRFRCHIETQRKTHSISFSIIPDEIPSIDQFPSEIKRFTRFSNGFIVISGKSNSGKTTTIAALVDEINKNFTRKIVTLEDHIEYLHKHDKSMIIQREVGSDTKTYSTGLIAAIREDADVIVVGELRTIDDFELALNAAEAGALVITNMHSPSSKDVLDRIVAMFPPDKQNQVKSQLATVVRGVVCQQLIPVVPGSNYPAPLVSAFEILGNNAEISSVIRDGDFRKIPSLIEKYRDQHMWTMLESLTRLKNEGIISAEEWINRVSLIPERNKSVSSDIDSI